MAGQGLDRIPLRIPERWDAAWFETFVRDVLALADVRNATEGAGISITGTSDELATLAASADVLELLEAGLLTAVPSDLENGRQLVAGGGITLTDDGPGETLTVSTTWYDIPGVPIYVESPSSPAWDFTLDGDVVGWFGVATEADQLATGSLPGDMVLAPSAGRVFVPVDLVVSGGNLEVDGPGPHFIYGNHLTIGASQGRLRFLEDAAAADNRIWDVLVSSERFRLRAVNDADSSATSFLIVDRTGTTVDLIQFNPTTEFEVNGTLIDLNAPIDLDTSSGVIALDVGGGYINVTGSSTSGTLAVLLNNALPRLGWLETDAAADNQLWYAYANAGLFVHAAVNDARSVVTPYITIARSGTTVTEIQLDATTFDLNGTLDLVGTGHTVSGSMTFTSAAGATTRGWPINLESTNPGLQWYETDGATDAKAWDLRASGGILTGSVWSDSYGATANWLRVLRTTTTVDEVELNATLFDFNGNLDVSGTGIVAGSSLTVGHTAGLFSGVSALGSSAVTSYFATFGAWANNNSNIAGIQFVKSRGATIGTHSLVSSGDNIGNVTWYGSDGTNYILAAQIRAEVDGTPGTNDMPGRVSVYTTPDGSSSGSERLRIDSVGMVRIIRTSSSTTQPALRIGDTTATTASYLVSAAAAAATNFFGWLNSSNSIESYWGSTSSVAYFGTRSNHPLEFYTNNVLAIAVSTSRAVSITSGADPGLHVTQAAGVGPLSLRLQTTDARQAQVTFLTAGTLRFVVGAAGTTNDIITGTAAGDAGLRTEGGNIYFSIDSGTTISARIGGSAASTTVPPLRIGTTTATAVACDMSIVRAGTVRLHWLNSSDGLEFMQGVTTLTGYLGMRSNHPVSLWTNNTERLIVAAAGDVTIGSSGATPTHRLNTNTATTVGAAGGASALPATPTGYVVININGTDRKIPYYAT